MFCWGIFEAYLSDLVSGTVGARTVGAAVKEAVLFAPGFRRAAGRASRLSRASGGCTMHGAAVPREAPDFDTQQRGGPEGVPEKKKKKKEKKKRTWHQRRVARANWHTISMDTK